MSYHFYGQADWFYGGKAPADSGQNPAPAGASPPSAPPPSSPKQTPPPASGPAPKSQAPAPMMEEEDEGGNLLLYAGIGVGVLAMILITVKFMKGSDDEVEEITAVTGAAAEPKTIKIEIG